MVPKLRLLACVSGLILLLLIAPSASRPLSKDGSFITPLYGNFTEMFLYWLKIEVGNPPIQYTVAFDTGSSDTLVPRVGCISCVGDPSHWFGLSSLSE
jgi:hypothetical protein